MKSISIIGCGAVGKTLGRLFHESGIFELCDILTRSGASGEGAVAFIGAGRPVQRFRDLRPAQLYLIAASDDAIASCVSELSACGSSRPGTVVFHVSGALPSSVLQPLREQGALAASVHPVKSFADPGASVSDFAGTFCGVEGDGEAVALLSEAFGAIGGRMFPLDPVFKTIYHAGSVLVCNYLTSLLEAGARAYRKGGVPPETVLKVMEPLVRGTVDNIFRFGTVQALTGPIARGDASVVAAQLDALEGWDPELADIYLSLSGIALDLSRRRGRAGEQELAAIGELLEERGLASDRLRQESRELKQRQALLETVIEGTSHCVFVKDLEGRHLLFNKGASLLRGRQAQDVLGRDTNFVFDDDIARMLKENDRQVVASGRTMTFRESVTDAEGRQRIFLSDKGPVFDEEGRITGVFGIAHDITEVVQAEEALLLNQQQLKSLAIELSLVEERERRRIAAELHDEIGQNLALARMKLTEIPSHSGLSASCAKSLREVGELMERSIQEVRSLTFQISPPLLYEVGLEAAVEWLAEHFEERHGLQIKVAMDSCVPPLGDEVSSTVYHAVRELLVNVVKHAQAKKVAISCRREGNSMQVVVRDDGKGFAAAPAREGREMLSGFGLFNIRQRIQHLGGELSVDAEPGFGTKVVISVPVALS